VSGFLLDTNVISELIKAKPEPRVTKWIESTDEDLLFLSVLTLGEIRKGIASLPQSARRAVLETWLDEPVADRWGQIAGSAAAKKSPLPVIDGLFAATAQHHNLILVTRNTRDIAATGVSAFDPWSV
jgi:toxin FitB